MNLFAGSQTELFLRLFVSLILGALIGIERTVAHKSAGIRTFGLVSLGSALFVVISEMINVRYAGVMSPDHLRIPSQIVVGIGFLGAGLIILSESKLKGLTTAAGLWVCAGIGMAIGLGFYELAIFSTILAIFILVGLWFLEEKVKKISPNQESDKNDFSSKYN